MKKVISIIVFACMVFGLWPISAFATETGHTHSWSGGWTANDTHHWHACIADGCTITSDAECSGYEAHDFSTYPYRCTVCEFSPGHEHYGGKATCEYPARCEGCGATYGEKDPNNHQIPEGFGEKIDSSSHKIMCSCGYVFVASEPHDFTPWDTNKDGTQERWCMDCLYAEMRTPQHSHSYSKATCIAPAICSCGSTTGEIDPSNHTGGTEIKNASEATYVADGYTGDTYCKGCGAKISNGEIVPKLKFVPTKIDEDAGVEDVAFQPSQWAVIPEDASLVVSNQKMGIDPIISILKPDTNISANHYGASVLRDAIYTHTNGTEYRSGEFVMIDEQEYCIGRYSGSGSVLPVISLSDGIMREYNMERLQFEETEGFQTNIQQTDDELIRIDGVLYSAPVSYTDANGSQSKVLYHEGKPAGMINDAGVSLYDDLTPTKVPTTGSRFLGTVTPDAEVNGFGLSVGKKYDVYLVGANDIQLLSGSGAPLFTEPGDARYEIGTVTQTFALDALDPLSSVFNNKIGAHYVAMHFGEEDPETWNVEDLDFGKVDLSSNGHQLSVAYLAYHFSPFVVYAFTEAQELEIKVITSNTSGVSDVGGADASDVTIPSDDHTWLWITISAFIAIGAVVFVVYAKKRKAVKEKTVKE